MSKFFEFLKKHFPIPRRYVMVMLIFYSLFNSFVQRTAIPITVVAMCNPLKTYDIYTWSHRQQTLINTAFNWVYPILQIPSGYLANRFGGKVVLGIGGTTVGILALLTPTCIALGGYKTFIAIRLLSGFFEGMTVPITLALISKWSPPRQLTLLSTIANSGVIIGMMTSGVFTGWFISYMGHWRPIFYFYGSLTICWICLWTLMAFDDPIDHPYISDEERTMIITEQAASVHQEHGDVPIKIILKSMAVWALVVAECGHDYGIFIYATMYPKFVNDVIHYNLFKNGLYSSLPYVGMYIVAMSSGFLIDFLLTHTKLGITCMRKTTNCISIFGNAGLVLMAFYIGNVELIGFTFIAALAFRGLYYTSIKINMVDLAPNYTGVLAGFVNGVGGVMGIIGPMLTYILIPNSSFEEWRLVFWIGAGVMIFSAIFYLFFGSGKIQWWNGGVDDEGRAIPPTAQA